jgi:hypothetical protein
MLNLIYYIYYKSYKKHLEKQKIKKESTQKDK